MSKYFATVHSAICWNIEELLMYIPCSLYSLFSRPTNAQHIYIYINNILYIYIKSILYIVSTSTCFDAPVSSPGRRILLIFYSYKNYYGYKLNRISRLNVYICDVYTYLFTYSLTPCSTVLLEKLTGLQLIKKFPTFYGTQRFITAFTSARHLFLS